MTCDTAFIRIARPAAEIFAFMADPAQMDRWAFGTWRTEIEGDLIRGASIKDGAEIFVRIDAHAEHGLIDYHIGAAKGALSPRIFARVTGEEVFGDGQGAGLSLTAFRGPAMDDARWDGLIAAHRVELDIVKSALETGYDHRA